MFSPRLDCLKLLDEDFMVIGEHPDASQLEKLLQKWSEKHSSIKSEPFGGCSIFSKQNNSSYFCELKKTALTEIVNMLTKTISAETPSYAR